MNDKKVNRREFIRSAAVTTCSIGLGFGFSSLTGCGRSYLTDPEKPNIIFITADDLGWKDLGCYGNREIATPNIDRLAKEGARFKNAFCITSSCSASRASFITGQYPHTNGVTALTHVYKLKSLRPCYRTLPSMLSDAGYNTALEGKWHVSPYLPVGWYGYQERLSGMFPKDMWIQGTEKTVDFIRRNKDNRFYLEINYMNNHRDAYGEFQFDPGFPVDPQKVHVPKYWTLPDWPEIRLEVAKYYSQTEKMDQMIGEVLRTLDELNLAENTLVIFVSDNGPPFPGNKMTLYDRGIGEPLIMRWPKKFPAGRTLEGMVSTIDIMPTVLDAVGLSIPDDIEGRSLFTFAAGEQSGTIRKAVFAEMTHHVHYLPTRAVRTERWKYIRNYSDIAKGLDQCDHMAWAHRLCELPNQPWKRPRVHEELYDLRRDPNEQVNLAGDERYKDDLERMRALLDQHMKETKDPFLGAPFTRDYDPAVYETRHPAGEKYK